MAEKGRPAVEPEKKNAPEKTKAADIDVVPVRDGQRRTPSEVEREMLLKKVDQLQTKLDEALKKSEPADDKKPESSQPAKSASPAPPRTAQTADTEQAKTKTDKPAETKVATKKAEPAKAAAAIPDPPIELDDDRKPALHTGGDVLIKDVTILTVTHGTIANGSILVKGGKIKAVGAGVTAPEGVKVINAAGMVAMPGIIDTHSHIAVQGGVNEGSLSIVPEVRVKDVVTGDDVAIYRAIAGGTTTARLLHGSANTIGGQDAVIKLKYGKPGRDLIIRDGPQGVKFALGENVTRSRGRFPNTRMGVESVIERAFEEGRAYRAQWDEYRKAQKTKRAEDLPPPPRVDLRLEALARRPGRLDQGAQPLLPQRRDLDALADGCPSRRARTVASARARGIQGCRRDRRTWRQLVDLLGLVGVQDRGVRRDSVQRRAA